MKHSQIPQRQGLYDPQFEHDACGIGFVAHIKGEKSHQIVRQSLTVLKNLSHRGGLGSEPTSGDGAGILLQIPHQFYEKAGASCGISLPPSGEYGTGLVFLPHEAPLRRSLENILNASIAEEGAVLLGCATCRSILPA